MDTVPACVNSLQNLEHIDVSNNVKKDPWKGIDLFAGIGGIRLGMQNAFGSDLKIVYSNEKKPKAIEVYKENFGDDPTGDITKIDPEQLPDFDILFGGFPCQPFSAAGKKKGFDDTRGTLFFHVANVLKAKKPDAFLLENVKHLVRHDKGKTFDVIKTTLEDLGYHVHHDVINAKDHGIPQWRERTYIVGFKDDLDFSFPEPTGEETSLADVLDKDIPKSFDMSERYYRSLQQRELRHKEKGNGFRYKFKTIDDVAETLTAGGASHETNLLADGVRRCSIDVKENCLENGTSISTVDHGTYKIRQLTPTEWKKLQGFPESFKFPVANTWQYKLLGNSVAIPVIEKIGKEMKRSLESKKLKFEQPLSLPKLRELVINGNNLSSSSVVVSSLPSMVKIINE